MRTLTEHKCNFPECGKVSMVIPSVAKNKKYCSATCCSKHQKELGIRKNNKNNSLENFIKIYGVDEGSKRHIEFREKLSKHLKNNPVDRSNYTMTDETKLKISNGRKKFNSNKKLKLDGLILDQQSIVEIQYNSTYGDGSYSALKERMKGVFTLNWFVDKYGEKEGNKKYTERCENIKRTTFFNYYNKVNKSNASKISQELFWILYNDESLQLNSYKLYFHELNHEHACGTGRNFDFVILDKNKIIEFNGDKFHANPTIYSPDDTPNPFIKTLKSSQIWADDLDKISNVERLGYEVLVIWESEYKNNKDRVIQRCKDFLQMVPNS